MCGVKDAGCLLSSSFETLQLARISEMKGIISSFMLIPFRLQLARCIWDERLPTVQKWECGASKPSPENMEKLKKLQK
jgi:hypothetical protein